MARTIPVRHLLGKLHQLPWPQQRLLLEAGLALALARLALLLLPFKLIMKASDNAQRHCTRHRRLVSGQSLAASGARITSRIRLPM